MFPRLQVPRAICSQGLGLGITLVKILNIYIYKSVHGQHRPWKRYGLLVMASRKGRTLVFCHINQIQ